MARRFIVNDEDIKNLSDNCFEISGSEVKHIQVLRHNVGDLIVVNKYICRISKMTKNTVILEIEDEAPNRGIPNINLTLYMAMVKNDKMDFIVQKAVELGVKKIVPFLSCNVIVKLDEKSKKKRKEKLQIIANEACKQCGRTDLVEVSDFISFDGMLNNLRGITLFAYENEKNSLKESINNIKDKLASKDVSINCIVGPEGGFTENEYKLLSKSKDTYTISLGSRILRAETAALNIISIIMYEFD